MNINIFSSIIGNKINRINSKIFVLVKRQSKLEMKNLMWWKEEERKQERPDLWMVTVGIETV